jgi:succinyl-CoA synthetase beta subunit
MAQVDERYLPVACDIKAAFDQDNPAWRRLGFPEEVFSTELSRFEAEINVLRTHQGQSDVVEINPQGSILPFMFGGGANSVATEVLGDRAILSSDFGGNPPYQKMKAIAEITMRHWLQQSRVLLIIGGRANNTDIYNTFKGIFDALREAIALNPDIHVVVGRGGPRLVESWIRWLAPSSSLRSRASSPPSRTRSRRSRGQLLGTASDFSWPTRSVSVRRSRQGSSSRS